MTDDRTFRRLVRSREFIADRWNAPLRLDDVAAAAGLSPFHFHRLFRRSFGETPHGYLTELRLKQARRLLAESDRSVTEICLEVGYVSLGTFSTAFRTRYGVTPTEDRRTLRGPEAIPVPACFWAR